jgi:hypothetical protein
MRSIENHCVGCTDLGLHCIGRHCRNRNVEVHYCDICGSELFKIHKADGKELCEDCYNEQYGEDDD